MAAKVAQPDNKVKIKAIKSDATKSPENLEHETTVKVKNFPQFLKQFKSEYEAAKSSSDKWNKRQENLYAKRFNIRPVVSFPWAGASNMALGIQDKTVRDMKPEYVGILWNTFPICDITSHGETPDQATAQAEGQKADRASWHLDWLVRTQMKAFPQVVIASDKVQAKGWLVVKTVYEKKTEPRSIILDREEMQISLGKKLVNPEDGDILDNPSKISILLETMAKVYGFDPEDQADNLRMTQIASEIYKGTKIIEFTIDTVIYDAPKLILIDGENITVPVGTPTILDFEKSRWIDEKYWLSPSELWDCGQSGAFKMSVVKEVMAKYHIDTDDIAKSQMKRGAGTTTESSQKDIREGLNNYGNQGNNIPMHQVSVWYDVKGDGVLQRCVFDYAEEYLEEDLRFIAYPFDMLCWPYVKGPFELTDERHYSPRGTVEIQNPAASAANMEYNQYVNRQTIATTGAMFYNQHKINPANMTFEPAQPVPVDGDPSSAVKWDTPPNHDQSYAMGIAFLKNLAAEQVSSPDVANPTSLAQGSGKSKQQQQAYLQQISSNHISVRQLDLQLWQAWWALVFERVWSLEMQYGPEERISYQDEQGNMTKFLKKDFFGKKYMFSLGGRFGVQNPLLQAQKKQARFHELTGNPFIDQYELVREYLESEDPRIAKKLLKPKQQVAQEQQAQQQQMIQGKVLEANLGILNKTAKKQQNANMKVTGGQAGQHNQNQTVTGR